MCATTDEDKLLLGLLADASKDLVKLGIKPQRVASILATTSQPLNVNPEAKDLVETLDTAVSSEGVKQVSKDKYIEILSRVCHSRSALPASFILPDVVSGKTDESGKFVPRKRGDPAVRAPDKFAAHVPGVDIREGQQAGKLVRIMVFRVREKAMKEVERKLCSGIVKRKYISHPNVLPFLGVSGPPSPFWMISRWMPNGNIFDYTQRASSENRLLLLAQSADGLEFLHSQKIVHGGVNPGNILISEDGVAHLADFGISVIMTDPEATSTGTVPTSKKGLTRYMAPEQIDPTQFGREHGDPPLKESDVHSFAMTAFEVLTRTKPYADTNDDGDLTLLIVVKRDRPPCPTDGILDPSLAESIWDVVKSCWKVDPSLRLNISEVCGRLKPSVGGDVAATNGTQSRTKPRPVQSQTTSVAIQQFTAQTPGEPFFWEVPIPSVDIQSLE